MAHSCMVVGAAGSRETRDWRRTIPDMVSGYTSGEAVENSEPFDCWPLRIKARGRASAVRIGKQIRPLRISP